MLNRITFSRNSNITNIDYFILLNSLFFLMMCTFVYYEQYRAAVNVHEYFIYASLIFLATFLIWYRYKHVEMKLSLLVLVELGIFLHFSGGLIEVNNQRLYEVEFYHIGFDKYVHFINSMIATFITLYVLAKRGLAPNNFIMLVAFLIVLGLGGVVEIIEFGITLIVENHGVGSYHNNMMDLVSNLLGAVSALFLFKYWLQSYVDNWHQ
ncbi:MAG: hypothetical protein U9R28_08325 [Pseudomonadota bacterium]|nr:hypothetical protein [Pseudomonadota bacterium]